ncbi:hypothetical protein fugu_013882 [Takifugu bimaculatus]|uniref:G-protein coupled receptors family 1 profile domain-containing protein n=1 Tax=Takifugu bimaculatus TaxID=433685 RepID=A0A4Z2C1E4_9TELE|nr:hypothetical protein fugu_013882 [Takifugu bimaculatus]
MSLHQSSRSPLCSVGGNCTSFQDEGLTRTAAVHQPDHTPTDPAHLPAHLFPTVDVPDHAHYIIGSVILLVGLTGMSGNALVIYVFCRSRTLRSPSNLLVSWPVKLYAFCGALFGIASMMTLTAIAVDRCLAITRPLARLGGMGPGGVLVVLAGVWLYSLCWSLPPFFGWSAYVPEGLQTSCSWDYMSFTAAVRSYTILLFAFVFFVPLGLIAGCYFAIFRAVRRAGQEVERLNGGQMNKAYERLRSEWHLAKVALGVILLFVVSWAPYSAVALTATAGYAHLLTPYMNSVPAVIAKASAIHNPIIYAITHPKYRAAIGRCVPLLRPLLRLQDKDLRSSISSSSALSGRVTGPSSPGARRGGPVQAYGCRRKNLMSSVTEVESCWTERETNGSGPVEPSGDHVSPAGQELLKGDVPSDACGRGDVPSDACGRGDVLARSGVLDQ